MNDKTKTIIEKAQIKNTLEQEFALMLDQRVERYFELRPHGIIPNSHFAPVSAECYLLYRDGHFYGAISLAQSVAEALIKFLCMVNGWKPRDVFEKNLEQLEKRKKVPETLIVLFKKIWENRNDYHHLNPQVEQDKQKLESLAKEKLSDLRDIEANLFAFSIKDGKLVPRYLKYWNQKQNIVSAFLRLD